jgi:hypothetical protein
MALFKGRSSLLEVQNRALIKTAKERAAQIEKLEAEVETLRRRAERHSEDIQRLTKRVSALEEENRNLSDAATNYSLLAQKQARELTEAAAAYSRWGQKLERELARIDPNGAAGRQFGGQDE